jgi:hypothetical protein
VLRECLSIREKAPKKDDRWIAEARRVLGGCLTKLAQFTEAETILVELANTLQGDCTATESRKTEAIQRVVDLYEAWHAAEPGQGHDAKADQWRARLPTKEEEQADDPGRSGGD